MNETTKYLLGAIAFLGFALIEAGDGCIFWSLLLFLGCCACLWHSLNLWADATAAKWQIERKREAQTLYHAEVYQAEE